MPETRQELEQKLLQYEQETERNKEAIQETRKLLERADKRRLENPAERSKWDRTLDNLEAALSENKQLLTASEINTIQVRRKLDRGSYKPVSPIHDESELSPEVDTAEATDPLSIPDNLSLDDLKAAVRRIVLTHIVKVHSISDLDYKLAKALIESRAAKNLSRDDTYELRKRLKILEKSRADVELKAVIYSEPKPLEEEVAPESFESIQEAVQGALEKCTEQNYDEMTLHEIERLITYRDLLATQADSSMRNLLPLVKESLEAIQTRLEQITF